MTNSSNQWDRWNNEIIREQGCESLSATGWQGGGQEGEKERAGGGEPTNTMEETLNVLTLMRWRGGISVGGPGTWRKTWVGRTGQWACSTATHSLPQDTRSGTLHPKAPDTSRHYDTHLEHSGPGAGRTHIGHLGVENEKVSLFYTWTAAHVTNSQVMLSYFKQRLLCYLKNDC